jgi:lysophospholipase L1-like esterase
MARQIKNSIIIKKSNNKITSLSGIFYNVQLVQSKTILCTRRDTKLLFFSVTLFLQFTLNIGSLHSQGVFMDDENLLSLYDVSNDYGNANIFAQPDNIKELQSRGYLPNFFQKIRNKDTVRIAYIGGSITQHEGWRVKSFNWFKNQYPGVYFQQINATIGGTTSRLAAFRYELDVLQKKPDLVFVEFAVNDDLLLTNEESKKGMEGLVRKTRLFDPGIDLCFVYTIRSTMLNDLKNERFPEKYELMEEIAGYYGIPSVNFGDTIAEMHNAGHLVFTGDLPSNPLDLPIVFSKDGVHPHIESGHVLYTESIIRSMKILGDSLGFINHSFPHVPLMENNYEDSRLVSVTPEMQQGKWEDVTRKYEDIISQYACKTPLPTWKTNSQGSSVSFEFNSSLIGIYDIKARDAGRIKVSIDNGPWKEYNMNVDGTIQRPILFENNLDNSQHHIRIEFSENSASGQAWYASSFIIRDDGTTYIDPDCEKEGNGSFNYPFNSWNEVEWKTGHTYLQKRGTVAREQVIIGASGSNKQYFNGVSHQQEFIK